MRTLDLMAPREALSRSARGAIFVPVGAVCGALVWHFGSVTLSLFDQRAASVALSETLTVLVAGTFMVGVAAMFIGLVFGLVVGVPLLFVLIYARVNNPVVCTICGGSAVAIWLGLPTSWSGFEAHALFAGAVGGLAAWYGSRPNLKVDSDARNSSAGHRKC